MANAGAQLASTFALACELQADWKLPRANDMLAPFNINLSEYGLVLQNFWNNAGQYTVSDPFGMVKQRPCTPGECQSPCACPGGATAMRAGPFVTDVKLRRW